MKQWLKLTTKQFDGGYIHLLYLKVMCMQYVQQFIKRERFVFLCLWDFVINSASQVTTSSKVRTAFNFIHIENYQIEFVCVCVCAKFPANQNQTK